MAQLEEFSVYDFATIPDLFVALKEAKGLRSKAFSLPQLATKLGFTSPRAVAMIINASRLPSANCLSKVEKWLKLDTRAARYLQLLALKQRLDSQKKNTLEIEVELRTLVPKERFAQRFNESAFAYISNWYSLVIKQLLGMSTNPMTAESIHARLGGRVSPEEVETALSNMQTLKIVEAAAKGGWTLSDQRSLLTEWDIPSKAIRNYHKQVLERAKRALDEQDVEDREYFTSVVSLRQDKVPEIKKQIRQFVMDLSRRYQANDGDAVFQLAAQFFKQTY